MDLLDNLNKEQEKAVTHGKEPLMIVAGAGTGKTTVITKRIAYLIMEKGIKPDEALALTFTDQAAGEMEARVDLLLPYGYVDLWISTFHSFCERVLRENALDIGLAPDFKLMDSTSAWLMVRKSWDAFDLDYYKPLGNSTKFIHSMLSHFSRCKDQEITPEEYLDYAKKVKLDLDSIPNMSISSDEKDSVLLDAKRVEEVADCYHQYQQLLLENNSLDFGDLINYTLMLFRERPRILAEYREKFKYILVDEFQDTNWAQFDLIKMLSAPKNNLTVVADDDQSIYHFRGASMSNILEFKKVYPNCQDIFLVNNYRSKQNILDLSYEFIQQNNPNRLEYQLKESKDFSGFTDTISKKLKANIGDKGLIEHIHEKTLEDEISAVAKKIVSIYQNDTEIDWQDFAILVRANNQAGFFMEKFENLGVPYTYIASRGLFSKEVVLDTLAYLRLVDNLYDDVSMFRVLKMDLIGLNTRDIIEITHYAKRKALPIFKVLGNLAVLEVEDDSRKKIETLLKFLEKHASLAKSERTIQIAHSFFIELGYLKYLEGNSEKIYHENVSYLNQFFKVIEKFEKDSSDRSLKAFLNYMDMLQEAGDEGNLAIDHEAGPDTVKIMTIHASKGLEFKYVFVVNMVDQRFPTNRRGESISVPDELVKEESIEGDIHLEEERRLFYVAVTRAKHGIFFASADDYGGARKKKLSRFLTEMGYEKPKEEVSSGKELFLPEKIVEKEESKNVEVPLPSKFSFTQLKVFATCPWQYKYAHLLKIPVLGRSSFSFGKTMHATLQTFFEFVMKGGNKKQTNLFGVKEEESQVPSVDDLLEIYENKWIDDWYSDEKQKKAHYDKGRKILRDFYKIYKGNFPVPLSLEQGFNLKIGSYTLAGKVDRIDPNPDGSVEIIDYKTGRVPESEKTIDSLSKNQLYIYHMAVEELLNKPVEKVTFYYLEENKAVSFVADQKKLDKVREDIETMINKIKISKFEPKPGPFTCKYCDYKNICGYRKL